MYFEDDDFTKLAQSVALFLNKTDLMTRLTTMPTLYLEVPNVSVMRRLHSEILAAMSPQALALARDGSVATRTEHMIKFVPHAGVSIVISCRRIPSETRFDRVVTRPIFRDDI